MIYKLRKYMKNIDDEYVHNIPIITVAWHVPISGARQVGIMIMVIHSKTSKCGNLLDTPRYLPRTPHPCSIHPTSLLGVVIFPYYSTTISSPATSSRQVRSAWCLARDSTCFPPHHVSRWTTSPSLYFHPHQAIIRSPLPVKHGARACVHRMRACERWPCALVRERSCNNNKKRATLWGTNGLRPVHPMLGGAGLILYPQWFSIHGVEDVDITIVWKFSNYTKIKIRYNYLYLYCNFFRYWSFVFCEHDYIKF